jgi:hypothetical protein
LKNFSDDLSADESDCHQNYFLTGFIAVIISLMFGVMYQSASAAPANGGGKIVLHFPKRPVGKLFKVKVLKDDLITRPTVADKSIVASGDVTVERSQAILFVMNYAGSEDSSFLEGMSDANVVVLDMTNLENVNDGTFKHLVKWTKLMRLLANGTDLSDEGLKNLKSLKNLKEINACGTLIKGTGLSALVDLPAIKHLNLARNGMRGCNFSQVSPLKNLMDMDLSGSSIGDEACVYLNRLTTLQWLNAAKNKITDVGISHLTGLKNLNQINLMGTLVTPASAVSLAKLPSLTHVILGEKQFSEAGVVRFKKALPKCFVELRVGDDKLDASVFAPLK